ncbi:MAG: beta-ketoacyl synthase N-terminal-like domain-containing protein [Sulfuricurvum sp.]|nr:beta-ketoacyl synthase N-terminal-like domain-containing protein [Sulfuricurvum sp.]
MKPLYIEAVSLLLQEASESSAELKKELERTSGQKFRRVNHFVLLALATVFRLPNLSNLDPKCALYIGTANGCVRDVVKMLEQMYRDTLLPMPFTFMGTSTSMAGFHIAQTLGLSGTALTVSNPYGAFEQALGMACTQLESGKSTSALVGCVDEGVFPLDEFKKVTQNDEEVVLEGGCWIKLALECANPHAVIIARESFKTAQAVKEYCEKQALSEPLTVIRNRESGYVGNSGGIDYVRALQEQQRGVIALITKEGKSRFSVTLTRLLG